MDLIQKRLDETKMLHNSHRIRYQRDQLCPNGKPNLLYTIPEAYSKNKLLLLKGRRNLCDNVIFLFLNFSKNTAEIFFFRFSGNG